QTADLDQDAVKELPTLLHPEAAFVVGHRAPSVRRQSPPGPTGSTPVVPAGRAVARRSAAPETSPRRHPSLAQVRGSCVAGPTGSPSVGGNAAGRAGRRSVGVTG